MSQFRLLHTMIRVRNLEQSINFYTQLLGMQVQSRQDYPDGKFTLVFVGYGAEKNNGSLELTHNWDQQTDYDLGNGYGHIALGVPDIYASCELLRKQGATISREPGPMKHGSTVIAFVRDPDGYAIELIQL